MGRNSWIMFGMIAIVIMSILLVALLILVPQSRPITSGVGEDYEAITQSEFSYTQSKDISTDAMKETYSITTEDIEEGKSSKLYKQGNTDPFVDKSISNNSGNTSTGGSSNTGSSGGNTNTSGSNNTNTNTNTNNNNNTGNSSNSGNDTINDEPPYSADNK